MTNHRRNKYRKKLINLLRVADDEAFLIMVWAVRAAQTERPDKARLFLNFPPEAATADISSQFAVHPWKCETLLNELLSTPKLKIISGQPNRRLNCKEFAAIATVVNALKDLENAEDNLTLKRVSVLKELHRLSQRQFEWQRGFLDMPQLYRSAFIYGGEKTKAFFAESNGFSMDEFTLMSFALHAQFMAKPGILRQIDLNLVGISETTKNAILDLISIPHGEARDRAATLRSGGGHIGYKPSLFREYPCIAFDNRVFAPLPDLVTLRATTGLFYDVISGGGDVKNEVSSRFESYCIELLQHMLPFRNVRSSFRYQLKKGSTVDSPDILVEDDHDTISIVFECKARRLSYEARFSEDPVADEREAYEEMAKGVFQIWRFVSHHRRGLIVDRQLCANVKGVVLTLDTWMSASGIMQEEVFALAQERADADSKITKEDRVPVIFCPITDLEQTLSVATDDSFFKAINMATEDHFQGWMLWSVHQEVAPDFGIDNDYPFEDRITEVLPWWNKFDDIGK